MPYITGKMCELIYESMSKPGSQHTSATNEKGKEKMKMNMLKRFTNILCILCVGSLAVGLWGCTSDESYVEVVDLDGVLNTFDDTLGVDSNQEIGESQPAPSEPFITPVEQEDDAKTQQFLTQFADKLNEGKLSSKNIGVALNDTGVIEGFADEDGDRQKAPTEQTLFDVEIDAENNRVIASQQVEGETYHRDHGFFPGGLFTGYLLGTMLSRQGMLGGGPRYASRPMSPRGYHASAVSTARSKMAARTARSRGGSSSFRGGGK
jgi:hypothetical protein